MAVPRILALVACLLSAACRGPAPAAGAEDELSGLHGFLQRKYGREREFLEEPRYSAAAVDLNGDGRAEAVVYLESRGFCGTGGCGFEVFERSGGEWRIVAQTSIGWPPVRVLESRSHGWRDLAVIVAGGGINPGYEALLPFDGRSYPDNPSMPPARPLRPPPPGQVLIPREPEWRPLFD
jgi:hypothetical protein